MAFCGNCGTRYEDGSAYCPSCGAPAHSAQQRTRQGYQKPVMHGSSSQADIRDAQDNKVMAVLAYIIFLIPLLAAKDSKFARYHTNQGLVLFLAALAFSVIISIVISILFSISWRVGLALSSILWLLSLIFVVLSIIGIINALNGRMKPLPIIGGITIIK